MADKLYPTAPVDAEDTPRPKSTGVAMWDVNTRAAVAACFIAFVYLCTLILAVIVAAAAVFAAMVYNNTFLVGLDSEVYAVGRAWFVFPDIHILYPISFVFWCMVLLHENRPVPTAENVQPPLPPTFRIPRRLHSSRFSQHIFYA